MKQALQCFVNSERYKQYNFADDDYADKLRGDDTWDFMLRVIKCAGPLLLLTRLGDCNQATMSKVRGTVDYIRSLMVETGDDTIEDKIAEAFHNRAADLDSDVSNAAYVIDQQFISKSRDAPADVMESFWKVCRAILAHDKSDDAWLTLRSTLAKELQAFRMKSGAWSYEDYTMDDTCAFWGVAGCHAPNLKKIALALAPLPCASSEAERNWFELKCAKTKKRNRLGAEKLTKMVFVRRFLRIKQKVVHHTKEIYSGWISQLLRDAAKVINPNATVVPNGGNDVEDLTTLIIFNDTIEPGEQGMINGKEPGQPELSLTNVRKNNAAKSCLFEKYYNMTFLDKNPEDDEDGDLEDETLWEHRHIQNVVWSRRIGWVVESVIIGAEGEDKCVETYNINEELLKMIRESPNNSRKIKSKIEIDDNPTNPTNQPDDSGSDSDSTLPANVVIENV